MKRKKNIKGLGRILTLALVLCLLPANLQPAAAVTQADIDALKDDAKGLAQEKKDIHQQHPGAQAPAGRSNQPHRGRNRQHRTGN